MDPHYFTKPVSDPLRVKSWIRISIRVKIQNLKRLKMEPWRAVNAHVDAYGGGFET